MNDTSDGCSCDIKLLHLYQITLDEIGEAKVVCEQNSTYSGYIVKGREHIGTDRANIQETFL